MDGETGSKATDVEELHAALRDQPWRFDFFQALRRIEAADRRFLRIGTSARPVEDPVRLGQMPSLAFPPSTVAQFKPADQAHPPRLLSLFFGLFGPNGALPLHLTEYAIERSGSRRDHTLVRFLDVFHHRMMSLFYRAWAIARPTASRDRPESDWFGRYLGSVSGYGSPALRRRDALPDEARLYYAGLLAAQSHHPYGLRAFLSDYFSLPVAVREFVGEWVVLPDQMRCRPGSSEMNATLGSTALLGACVWSVQHRFRLILGPVSLADFERFLPGSPSLQRLVAAVRTYVGDELAWDVNLVLKRAEVPKLELGRFGRLGWTTWLPGTPVTHDADDLVLEPCR